MSSRVKSGASSPTLTGSVRFGSSFGLPRTPRAVPAVVMLATSSTSAEMTNDNFAVLLFICFSLGWNAVGGTCSAGASGARATFPCTGPQALISACWATGQNCCLALDAALRQLTFQAGHQ